MLLILLFWISLTGENSGIEISSSLEAGLEHKFYKSNHFLCVRKSVVLEDQWCEAVLGVTL